MRDKTKGTVTNPLLPSCPPATSLVSHLCPSSPRRLPNEPYISMLLSGAASALSGLSLVTTLLIIRSASRASLPFCGLSLSSPIYLADLCTIID